ncbi:hypothetical protein BDQ12DRAFT_722765 [Crucibulum laeve]|uniref:Trehalase-like N-terminal domain-containing protein n=1 Tax=Crucibulum laeve TaxID=68775 RepID=A0A5C3M0F5_9AGAR|nr:hypothetical protein BDQ12DRAFT_722765 [Crucibulum laeve]
MYEKRLQKLVEVMEKKIWSHCPARIRSSSFSIRVITNKFGYNSERSIKDIPFPSTEDPTRRCTLPKDGLVTQPFASIDTIADIIAYSTPMHGACPALGWCNIFKAHEEEKEVKKIVRALVDLGVRRVDVLYIDGSDEPQLATNVPSLLFHPHHHYHCPRHPWRIWRTHSLNEPSCIGLFTNASLLPTLLNALSHTPSAKRYGAYDVCDIMAYRDYIAITGHGLIGNLRTATLVSLGGSIESYCAPNFDSPSVSARILDKNKGGHFSITPTIPFSTKQNYLPSSNSIHLTNTPSSQTSSPTHYTYSWSKLTQTPSSWLILRMECIRNRLPILMQCAPASNYARDSHTTGIVIDNSIAFGPRQRNVLFEFTSLTLDLRYVVEATMDTQDLPVVNLETLDLSLRRVTFILRTPTTDFACTKDSASDSEDSSASLSPSGKGVTTQPTQEGWEVAAQRDTHLVSSLPRGRTLDNLFLTKELVSSLPHTTSHHWYDWIHQSTYTGSWKEAVHCSALALMLLIYGPTGAVVASPIFSLPQYIGSV